MSLYNKIKLKILLISAKKAGFINFSTHLLLPEILSKDSIVIDIGGNKGDFSNTMIETFNCHCYYIDADPNLIKHIKDNPNLTKNNLAISNTKGIREFYLSNNSEANSFNKKIAEQYGIKEIIPLTTTQLPDFLQENNIANIDLLKIDIEGGEIELIEGLSDEFLLTIPQMTIEFHEVYDSTLLKPTLKIMNRMKCLGFKIIIYNSNTFENVLFLNKNIKLTFFQKFWITIHDFFQYKVNTIVNY